MRVYEYSKQHGLNNKEVVELLKSKGFDVSSHMSVLSDKALEFLSTQFVKKTVTSQKAPEEPAVAQPKIEEKVKPMQTPISQPKQQVPVSAPTQIIHERKITPKQPAEITITLSPMSINELAQKLDKQLSEVILTLLKQGIVATKNQIISEKIVAQLAHFYGAKVVQPEQERPKESAVVRSEMQTGVRTPRLPIVVVIGHVDHGKTTLLDFIRKTRIAAREKGGITQHIGAYEAATKQGNIVFLDTPGHEAFTMMRVRGLKVADIAILVIAADDGIMPQTVEAIKIAQNIGLPIIVAINKIDKATPSQIESVKRELAQHNLVPEAWGGQTIVVPISAKLGTGIDDLLDVVVLQSQIMELTALLDVPARGFILESKLEKGRGPVATVICQNGILHVGDYFIAGNTQGRVSSLIDSNGQRIRQASPSQPVQISGFVELPRVGDIFEVVSAEELKKTRILEKPSAVIRPVARENALNLIIKTDSISSQEALLNSLSKMSGKTFKEIYVVHVGVGAINESDVILASDTKSIIYGLHTKVEPNSVNLAQKMGVTIRLFDIIYKLLEDVALIAEQGKPVKKVLRKVGEATVLKVFDIKNLGIIAGAQVRQGRFTKDCKVTIWRGKNKIGEGMIKSLQRDRKTVKEVHTGFECAFMVEGFAEWQVDDRVECYLEVAEV